MKVKVFIDEDDEENGKGNSGGPRPNAYWQRIREAGEDGIEADTFGGSFRGVKAAPHGGAATVRPDATIGSDDLCWCGEPAGHDWPGKRVGAKHPKERELVNTRIKDHVDRGDLRAYHRQLQDFIMHAVNEDHLDFRLGKNSILLYPKDNTGPATVYARNSDRQVKQLQKWYLVHVLREEKPKEPESEKVVEPDALEELAKTVNDPVEHPTKTKGYEVPGESFTGQVQTPAPAANPPSAPQPESAPSKLAQAEASWGPYYSDKGTKEHEFIETNGTHVRCKACIGTEHALYTTDKRSIGGHVRMWHRDRGDLYSPEKRHEAAQKANTTRRNKRMVALARDLMKELGAPVVDPEKHAKMLEQNVSLKAQVAALKGENLALREKVDAGNGEWQKRAEEAEAKLALIREASAALDA